jgi:hypothetical protein
MAVPDPSVFQPRPLDGEVASFEVGRERLSLGLAADGFAAHGPRHADGAAPRGGVQAQLRPWCVANTVCASAALMPAAAQF